MEKTLIYILDSQDSDVSTILIEFIRKDFRRILGFLLMEKNSDICIFDTKSVMSPIVRSPKQ